MKTDIKSSLHFVKLIVLAVKYIHHVTPVLCSLSFVRLSTIVNIDSFYQLLMVIVSHSFKESKYILI
jgi:hypothetical protein